MTEEIKKILDFHADDFGISRNTTDDILKLLSNGLLNSISIMPNMAYYEYAVEKLKELNTANPDKAPLVTVHLNFLEGHCCAPVEQVPDLVDEKGYFKITWGSLFKWNYNPFAKKRIKKQLITEITAQTQKCIDTEIVPIDNLRFDGHQHTQMIPIVFNSLLAVCKNYESKGCKTTFIRNTQDPIFPYFKASKKDKELRKSFKKINIVKCLILNHYSNYVRKALKKHSIPCPYLCGVFFSGHMDYERLEKVLPTYCKKPLKQNRNVELLFHPGTLLESELSEEFVNPDNTVFYLSPNRKTENESVEKLRG